MSMTTNTKKLDLNFLGALGSCIEQYIRGKITKLDILKILNQNLSEKDKKNWDSKTEFKGHELIETFLELKGMTQVDLAREADLSASKINDLIKGRISITPKTAKKLASIFEVDHTVFL